MKEKITISRLWANPTITAFVSNKEVGASMDLDVFLRTLVDGVGNPTMFVTKAQLLSKLTAVSEQVLQEMKRATVTV